MKNNKILVGNILISANAAFLTGLSILMITLIRLPNFMDELEDQLGGLYAYVDYADQLLDIVIIIFVVMAIVLVLLVIASWVAYVKNSRNLVLVMCVIHMIVCLLFIGLLQFNALLSTGFYIIGTGLYISAFIEMNEKDKMQNRYENQEDKITDLD